MTIFSLRIDFLFKISVVKIRLINHLYSSILYFIHFFINICFSNLKLLFLYNNLNLSEYLPILLFIF